MSTRDSVRGLCGLGRDARALQWDCRAIVGSQVARVHDSRAARDLCAEAATQMSHCNDSNSPPISCLVAAAPLTTATRPLNLHRIVPHVKSACAVMINSKVADLAAFSI
jgi:hypothetical protein